MRRVEEFLDAHERAVPSLAELCSVAGVGERTLESAFQALARATRRRR